MDKKRIMKISAIVAAGVLVLTVCICVYTNSRVPDIVEPTQEIDEEVSKAPKVGAAEISVPEILADVSSAPDVIPDPADEVEQFEVDTTETTAADGSIVQTPNWEAQKELAEGTDLEDMETVPQYKYSGSNNSDSNDAPASSDNSNPKNGDKKDIDGTGYKYVEGFGWVKVGGDNIIVEDLSDLELSGNKIGY